MGISGVGVTMAWSLTDATDVEAQHSTASYCNQLSWRSISFDFVNAVMYKRRVILGYFFTKKDYVFIF